VADRLWDLFWILVIGVPAYFALNTFIDWWQQRRNLQEARRIEREAQWRDGWRD